MDDLTNLLECVEVDEEQNKPYITTKHVSDKDNNKKILNSIGNDLGQQMLRDSTKVGMKDQ